MTSQKTELQIRTEKGEKKYLHLTVSLLRKDENNLFFMQCEL